MLTDYQAKTRDDRVLYQGVSLQDIKEQIIQKAENNDMCAPDICVITVYHDGYEFNMDPVDVKAFNEELADLCLFKFWEDEDGVRSNYDELGY